MFEFAGDFLTCCGEGTTERGPWGEKAGWEGWFEAENGVETGGVATTCAAGCLPPGVGVAIAKTRGRYEKARSKDKIVILGRWARKVGGEIYRARVC